MDLLARELGNWRTSSRSGPAYQGLADGIRLLIVDGRTARRRTAAQRARAGRRAAGVPHDRHRGVRPAARGRLPERPPRRAQHHGAARSHRPPRRAPDPRAPTVSLAAATLSAPAAAVARAFAEAAARGHALSARKSAIELVGVDALREAIAERYCARGLPTEPDEIMVTTGALHADRPRSWPPTSSPATASWWNSPPITARCRPSPPQGRRPVPVAMTDDGWELDAIARRGAVSCRRAWPI